MLNESEIRSLATASSRSELKNRAQKIKESIHFTFGGNSPHLEPAIKELEKIVEEQAKMLPEVSEQELNYISIRIQDAKTREEIHEYISLLTTRYQALNPDIRKTIKEAMTTRNRRQAELEEQQIRAAKSEEEFQLLVEEMKPKGFKTSSEVSNYIVENKLASKYKNISGILVLEDGENPWDFPGGISPNYYARLCKELGLGQKNSRATVESFTSFEELEKMKKQS